MNINNTYEPTIGGVVQLVRIPECLRVFKPGDPGSIPGTITVFVVHG